MGEARAPPAPPSSLSPGAPSQMPRPRPGSQPRPFIHPPPLGLTRKPRLPSVRALRSRVGRLLSLAHLGCLLKAQTTGFGASVAVPCVWVDSGMDWNRLSRRLC